jgi:hypothetical protein
MIRVLIVDDHSRPRRPALDPRTAPNLTLVGEATMVKVYA